MPSSFNVTPFFDFIRELIASLPAQAPPASTVDPALRRSAIGSFIEALTPGKDNTDVDLSSLVMDLDQRIQDIRNDPLLDCGFSIRDVGDAVQRQYSKTQVGMFSGLQGNPDEVKRSHALQVHCRTAIRDHLRLVRCELDKTYVWVTTLGALVLNLKNAEHAYRQLIAGWDLSLDVRAFRHSNLAPAALLTTARLFSSTSPKQQADLGGNIKGLIKRYEGLSSSTRLSPGFHAQLAGQADLFESPPLVLPASMQVRGVAIAGVFDSLFVLPPGWSEDPRLLSCDPFEFTHLNSDALAAHHVRIQGLVVQLLKLKEIVRTYAPREKAVPAVHGGGLAAGMAARVKGAANVVKAAVVAAISKSPLDRESFQSILGKIDEDLQKLERIQLQLIHEMTRRLQVANEAVEYRDGKAFFLDDTALLQWLRHQGVYVVENAHQYEPGQETSSSSVLVRPRFSLSCQAAAQFLEYITAFQASAASQLNALTSVGKALELSSALNTEQLSAEGDVMLSGEILLQALSSYAAELAHDLNVTQLQVLITTHKETIAPLLKSPEFWLLFKFRKGGIYRNEGVLGNLLRRYGYYHLLDTGTQEFIFDCMFRNVNVFIANLLDSTHVQHAADVKLLKLVVVALRKEISQGIAACKQMALQYLREKIMIQLTGFWEELLRDLNNVICNKWHCPKIPVALQQADGFSVDDAVCEQLTRTPRATFEGIAGSIAYFLHLAVSDSAAPAINVFEPFLDRLATLCDDALKANAVKRLDERRVIVTIQQSVRDVFSWVSLSQGDNPFTRQMKASQDILSVLFDLCEGLGFHRFTGDRCAQEVESIVEQLAGLYASTNLGSTVTKDSRAKAHDLLTRVTQVFVAFDVEGMLGLEESARSRADWSIGMAEMDGFDGGLGKLAFLLHCDQASEYSKLVRQKLTNIYGLSKGPTTAKQVLEALCKRLEEQELSPSCVQKDYERTVEVGGLAAQPLTDYVVNRFFNVLEAYVIACSTEEDKLTYQDLLKRFKYIGEQFAIQSIALYQAYLRTDSDTELLACLPSFHCRLVRRCVGDPALIINYAMMSFEFLVKERSLTTGLYNDLRGQSVFRPSCSEYYFLNEFFGYCASYNDMALAAAGNQEIRAEFQHRIDAMLKDAIDLGIIREDVFCEGLVVLALLYGSAAVKNILHKAVLSAFYVSVLAEDKIDFINRYHAIICKVADADFLFAEGVAHLEGLLAADVLKLQARIVDSSENPGAAHDCVCRFNVSFSQKHLFDQFAKPVVTVSGSAFCYYEAVFSCVRDMQAMEGGNLPWHFSQRLSTVGTLKKAPDTKPYFQEKYYYRDGDENKRELLELFVDFLGLWLRPEHFINPQFKSLLEHFFAEPIPDRKALMAYSSYQKILGEGSFKNWANIFKIKEKLEEEQGLFASGRDLITKDISFDFSKLINEYLSGEVLLDKVLRQHLFKMLITFLGEYVSQFCQASEGAQGPAVQIVSLEENLKKLICFIRLLSEACEQFSARKAEDQVAKTEMKEVLSSHITAITAFIKSSVFFVRNVPVSATVEVTGSATAAATLSATITGRSSAHRTLAPMGTIRKGGASNAAFVLEPVVIYPVRDAYHCVFNNAIFSVLTVELARCIQDYFRSYPAQLDSIVDVIKALIRDIRHETPLALAHLHALHYFLNIIRASPEVDVTMQCQALGEFEKYHKAYSGLLLNLWRRKPIAEMLSLSGHSHSPSALSVTTRTSAGIETVITGPALLWYAVCQLGMEEGVFDSEKCETLLQQYFASDRQYTAEYLLGLSQHGGIRGLEVRINRALSDYNFQDAMQSLLILEDLLEALNLEALHYVMEYIAVVGLNPCLKTLMGDLRSNQLDTQWNFKKFYTFMQKFIGIQNDENRFHELEVYFCILQQAVLTALEQQYIIVLSSSSDTASSVIANIKVLCSLLENSYPDEAFPKACMARLESELLMHFWRDAAACGANFSFLYPLLVTIQAHSAEFQGECRAFSHATDPRHEEAFAFFASRDIAQYWLIQYGSVLAGVRAQISDCCLREIAGYRGDSNFNFFEIMFNSMQYAISKDQNFADAIAVSDKVFWGFLKDEHKKLLRLWFNILRYHRKLISDPQPTQHMLDEIDLEVITLLLDEELNNALGGVLSSLVSYVHAQAIHHRSSIMTEVSRYLQDSKDEHPSLTAEVHRYSAPLERFYFIFALIHQGAFSEAFHQFNILKWYLSSRELHWDQLMTFVCPEANLFVWLEMINSVSMRLERSPENVLALSVEHNLVTAITRCVYLQDGREALESDVRKAQLPSGEPVSLENLRCANARVVREFARKYTQAWGAEAQTWVANLSMCLHKGRPQGSEGHVSQGSAAQNLSLNDTVHIDLAELAGQVKGLQDKIRKVSLVFSQDLERFFQDIDTALSNANPLLPQTIAQAGLACVELAGRISSYPAYLAFMEQQFFERFKGESATVNACPFSGNIQARLLAGQDLFAVFMAVLSVLNSPSSGEYKDYLLYVSGPLAETFRVLIKDQMLALVHSSTFPREGEPQILLQTFEIYCDLGRLYPDKSSICLTVMEGIQQCLDQLNLSHEIEIPRFKTLLVLYKTLIQRVSAGGNDFWRDDIPRLALQMAQYQYLLERKQFEAGRHVSTPVIPFALAAEVFGSYHVDERIRLDRATAFRKLESEFYALLRREASVCSLSEVYEFNSSHFQVDEQKQYVECLRLMFLLDPFIAKDYRVGCEGLFALFGYIARWTLCLHEPGNSNLRDGVIYVTFNTVPHAKSQLVRLESVEYQFKAPGSGEILSGNIKLADNAMLTSMIRAYMEGQCPLSQLLTGILNSILEKPEQTLPSLVESVWYYYQSSIVKVETDFQAFQQLFLQLSQDLESSDGTLTVMQLQYIRSVLDIIQATAALVFYRQKSISWDALNPNDELERLKLQAGLIHHCREQLVICRNEFQEAQVSRYVSRNSVAFLQGGLGNLQKVLCGKDQQERVHNTATLETIRNCLVMLETLRSSQGQESLAEKLKQIIDYLKQILDSINKTCEILLVLQGAHALQEKTATMIGFCREFKSSVMTVVLSPLQNNPPFVADFVEALVRHEHKMIEAFEEFPALDLIRHFKNRLVSAFGSHHAAIARACFQDPETFCCLHRLMRRLNFVVAAGQEPLAVTKLERFQSTRFPVMYPYQRNGGAPAAGVVKTFYQNEIKRLGACFSKRTAALSIFADDFQRSMLASSLDGGFLEHSLGNITENFRDCLVILYQRFQTQILAYFSGEAFSRDSLSFFRLVQTHKTDWNLWGIFLVAEDEVQGIIFDDANVRKKFLHARALMAVLQPLFEKLISSETLTPYDLCVTWQAIVAAPYSCGTSSQKYKEIIHSFQENIRKPETLRLLMLQIIKLHLFIVDPVEKEQELQEVQQALARENSDLQALQAHDDVLLQELEAPYRALDDAESQAETLKNNIYKDYDLKPDAPLPTQAGCDDIQQKPVIQSLSYAVRAGFDVFRQRVLDYYAACARSSGSVAEVRRREQSAQDRLLRYKHGYEEDFHGDPNFSELSDVHAALNSANWIRSLHRSARYSYEAITQQRQANRETVVLLGQHLSSLQTLVSLSDAQKALSEKLVKEYNSLVGQVNSFVSVLSAFPRDATPNSLEYHYECLEEKLQELKEPLDLPPALAQLFMYDLGLLGQYITMLKQQALALQWQLAGQSLDDPSQSLQKVYAYNNKVLREGGIALTAGQVEQLRAQWMYKAALSLYVFHNNIDVSIRDEQDFQAANERLDVYPVMERLHPSSVIHNIGSKLNRALFIAQTMLDQAGIIHDRLSILIELADLVVQAENLIDHILQEEWNTLYVSTVEYNNNTALTAADASKYRQILRLQDVIKPEERQLCLYQYLELAIMGGVDRETFLRKNVAYFVSLRTTETESVGVEVQAAAMADQRVPNDPLVEIKERIPGVCQRVRGNCLEASQAFDQWFEAKFYPALVLSLKGLIVEIPSSLTMDLKFVLKTVFHKTRLIHRLESSANVALVFQKFEALILSGKQMIEWFSVSDPTSALNKAVLEQSLLAAILVSRSSPGNNVQKPGYYGLESAALLYGDRLSELSDEQIKPIIVELHKQLPSDVYTAILQDLPRSPEVNTLLEYVSSGTVPSMLRTVACDRWLKDRKHAWDQQVLAIQEIVFVVLKRMLEGRDGSSSVETVSQQFNDSFNGLSSQIEPAQQILRMLDPQTMLIPMNRLALLETPLAQNTVFFRMLVSYLTLLSPNRVAIMEVSLLIREISRVQERVSVGMTAWPPFKQYLFALSWVHGREALENLDTAALLQTRCQQFDVLFSEAETVLQNAVNACSFAQVYQFSGAFTVERGRLQLTEAEYQRMMVFVCVLRQKDPRQIQGCLCVPHNVSEMERESAVNLLQQADPYGAVKKELQVLRKELERNFSQGLRCFRLQRLAEALLSQPRALLECHMLETLNRVQALRNKERALTMKLQQAYEASDRYACFMQVVAFEELLSTQQCTTPSPGSVRSPDTSSLGSRPRSDSTTSAASAAPSVEQRMSFPAQRPGSSSTPAARFLLLSPPLSLLLDEEAEAAAAEPAAQPPARGAGSGFFANRLAGVNRTEQVIQQEIEAIKPQLLLTSTKEKVESLRVELKRLQAEFDALKRQKTLSF